MVTSKALTPGSSTTIAVTELRDLIFAGSLGAGTDHLESELAERLGMSRTPVREALLRLEAQGLVEVRPRKGVRITPLSPADMTEIYDILTELESLAAANAAKRSLTDTQLVGLSTAIAEMSEAVASEDRDAWAKADERFHNELVILGDNSRVALIVEMMSDQVRRARLVTLYMRPLETLTSRDHAKVLNAIRQGDADAARRAHHANRTAAKDVLIELLERHRLQSL